MTPAAALPSTEQTLRKAVPAPTIAAPIAALAAAGITAPAGGLAAQFDLPALPDFDGRPRLGPVFALLQNLRPQSRRIGVDLSDWSGDTDHKRLLAATTIFDAASAGRRTFATADFTKRAEPAAVSQALKTLF